MATREIRFESPLIVIVGPTASGKTALAIALAEKYDGEIICADSRTIYRGMDIGTAKPSLDEQRKVPHWGIDLAEPGERFTVADFQRYAYDKIKEIRQRGKTPIVVGGSGLYVDSLIYGYQFSDGYDEQLRQKLSKMSVDQLQGYCYKNNISLSHEYQNKRRIIRAIERKSHVPINRSPTLGQIIVVGIATDKHTLVARINKRAEQIFQNKIVEEAIVLGKKYGWNSEAMTGNIYPIMQKYIEDSIDIEKAKELFAASDRQLAKRQMTWFRRSPTILWGKLEDIAVYIDTVIARF